MKSLPILLNTVIPKLPGLWGVRCGEERLREVRQKLAWSLKLGLLCLFPLVLFFKRGEGVELSHTLVRNSSFFCLCLPGAD